MIAPPFVAVPPVRYGGTELVVAALVDGLLARGHAVTLYASRDSSIGARVHGWYERAVWPPDPQRELVHAATAAWEVLAGASRFDVVHAHTSPVVAFAPLFPIPTVYTVHHAREEGTCELLRAAARPRLTTVAISARQRQLLGSEIPASVIHHGLSPERYPFGRGGKQAAFIGRFAQEKGVHHALDAAAKAQVPILLGGRPHPPDEAWFEAEVAGRLERPGVRWFGEVGLETKARMLGGSAATLFPVEWEEPFGLVMVESMLCGTPVIAYSRGAVPEIVEEGVTGFLVNGVEEMAERLGQVASGRRPFDRRRCREAALARFGADRMVDDYLALYEALVRRPVLALEEM